MCNAMEMVVGGHLKGNEASQTQHAPKKGNGMQQDESYSNKVRHIGGPERHFWAQ